MSRGSLVQLLVRKLGEQVTTTTDASEVKDAGIVASDIEGAPDVVQSVIEVRARARASEPVNEDEGTNIRKNLLR